MKWSLRLGQVGSVRLAVHGAFLLLLGWEMLSGLLDSPAVLRGQTLVHEGLFVLAVFQLLLLHELGHLLAATRYGVKTREIILLPLGGIARLDRPLAGVGQEVVYAMAGPLVNLFLAGGLLAGLVVAYPGLRLSRLTWDAGGLMTRLFWVNVALAGGNLLPILPLDGGRVLRAVLARREDLVQATQTADVAGQGFLLLVGFTGLLSGNALLLFLALCLWIGSTQEAGPAPQTLSLAGLQVRQAMIRNFRTLRPEDPLAVAIGHVLAGFPHDFPVEENGHLIGMVLRGDLLTTLARRGESTRVAEVMRRDHPTATPAQSLAEVLEQFRDCDFQALPVVQDGKVVGLLTMDALGELLALRSKDSGMLD